MNKNKTPVAGRFSQPGWWVPSVMIGLLTGLYACQDFLDANSNASRVIPATLEDCRALLDDYERLNAGYPYDGETASDNYYLTDANWGALYYDEDRLIYLRDPEVQRQSSSPQWLNLYKVVYTANLVLETLDKMTMEEKERNQEKEEENYYTLRGSALFFRAYAFYEAAQLWAQPYEASTAGQYPGIPLRLSPDIGIRPERGTVEETYDRILTDLQEAASLLPESSRIQSRPDKAAALAALARTCLAMGDYTRAGKYAGDCLTLHNQLMDYNTLNANSITPFQRFNGEVIFHSVTGTSLAMYPTYARADTLLFASYAENDLRRVLFFRKNPDGTYAFKGNYDNTYTSAFFNGLTTGEIYLVQAECYARAGNKTAALNDLNTLLEKRWKEGTYVPFTATSAEKALELILTERRKELLFRGLRWSDLRRLNKDSRFAATLKRVINGQTYELPPNDLRYVFLIPQDVIEQTGMEQNPR